jgi:preprotein translocase subunit SecG
MSILTGILSVALILVSLFLVLLVLMQKTKDGGMGAALGGGATESAFGHETGNVLTGATIKAAIAFFTLSLVLYLGGIYKAKHGRDDTGGLLEKLPVTAPAPATTSPLVPTATPGTTTPAAATTSTTTALPAVPEAPAANAVAPAAPTAPAAPAPVATP